jgi:GntR family transcriptional regulator, transcriptional repressor for pyruvate dehydrogenase complex
MLTCGKCHDLMDAPCQGATSVPAVTKKQRIIDDVTADIREGRLKTGDQLPTTPAFVALYDASIPTVRAAMSLLQAAGLVYSVPGAGIFVT